MVVAKGDATSELSTQSDSLSIERVNISDTYSNLSGKFLNKERDFSRQYAFIYAARLNLIRDVFTKKAIKKWGDGIEIMRLFELSQCTSDECIIFGTLFKHQELKPNILKEVCEELDVPVQPPSVSYVSDDDMLILEDESQRIQLVGIIDMNKVVTGVVCAILGKEEEGGKFRVHDICWPGLPSQVERPLPENDVYVLLTSGLELPQVACLKLQLLVDWVSGYLGEEDDQQMASTITRVIIAGNSLNKDTKNKDLVTKARYLTKNSQAGTVDAMKNLDDVVLQLCSLVDVDIMPGEHDASNFLLPQQPLHYCMFPQSNHLSSLNCVTNPYSCSINNRILVGSSGQPIHDILKCSLMNDALEAMNSTLDWGHMAPTCPDTLGCYPYYSDDPFIFDVCPDVYFVGNQAKFQTSIYKGPEGQSVRVVCVPAFSESSSCVLLNLRTLDCTLINCDLADID